uniref:Uncharacterized protein n=1 Tax=Astatotilapia calliptera TaxID=8154 RepID=A0AAX7USU9_ASTCA
AVLSFSLYMWHLQGPDIPLKRASERERGGKGHRELCQKHSKYPDCSANSIQIFIPASKYVFTASQIVTHMDLTVIFPSSVCWRAMRQTLLQLFAFVPWLSQCACTDPSLKQQ